MGYKTNTVELTETELESFKIFHRGKSKKKAFLKYLVTVKGLHSKSGVQLCSTSIGLSLKLSYQSVLNYLAELKKLGFITCLNSGYKMGVCSRVYRCASESLFELFDKYCNKISDSVKAKRHLNKLKVRKRQIAAIRKINRKKQVSYADALKLAWLYIGYPRDLVNDIRTYIDDQLLTNSTKGVEIKANRDNRGYLCFYYALKAVYKRVGFKKNFTINYFRTTVMPYDRKETKCKDHISLSYPIGYKEFRQHRSTKFNNMLFCE